LTGAEYFVQKPVVTTRPFLHYSTFYHYLKADVWLRSPTYIHFSLIHPPNLQMDTHSKEHSTYVEELHTYSIMEQSTLQCIQVAMMMHGKTHMNHSDITDIKIVFRLKQQSAPWLTTRRLFGGMPPICRSNKTFPTLCNRVRHFADSCTAIVTSLQQRLSLDTLYRIITLTYPFETERLGMSWFKNIILYAKDPTQANGLAYQEWVDSMCVYILEDVTYSIQTNLEEEDKPQTGTFIIKQD